MPSPRRTKTTDSHGAKGKAAFSDITVIRDINTAVISRIVITSDIHLRSITVHYADVIGVTHGSAAGVSAELTLPPGEFIRRIEGTYIPSLISKIEFVTSKGRKWGPFGDVLSTSTFIWDGFEPGMGLLYLSGKADGYIGTLKATFGMYQDPAEQPAGVKYEEHITSEAAAQASTPWSTFANVLTSRTVTLLIGTDNTKLNVSQQILCRLPFFRAALQGNFREATEQTVTMPEDEPRVFTALVEFLYTNWYTYPYYVAVGTGCGTPVPDLAEGLYHASVYATAHKYDYPELEVAALDLFMYVLKHLEGMDVVRLWKGAYAMNLILPEVEENEKLVEFRRRLPGLLKELYIEHRTEMESAAVEYPMLWSDLMRLALSQ